MSIYEDLYYNFEIKLFKPKSFINVFHITNYFASLIVR